MQTRLHFSRFEFKYILPRAVRDDLESELQYFIELDPFVEKQPGKKYLVRSLYYDNQAMACYYEKIDGVKRRAKFRVRTYTDVEGDGTASFLEIKGRHNAQVFKHRTELAAGGSCAEASDNFYDETTRNVLGRLEEGAIKSQFICDLHKKALAPKMLIDYRRRPYFSKYDPEFRLTFDDSLSSAATSRLFPRAWEPHRRFLPGYTILEVKFRQLVPSWFHRIIQTFELRRISVSKYCAGVEAFDLTPKLE